MNDNVSCGEIRFIEDAGFWVRCLRERELHGIAAAFENIAKERDSLRARVAELEARIAELQPMAQCAAIMAVCGYFSRLRRPDAWLTQWPDGIKSTTRYWPDGWIGSNEDNFSVFPLYAGSAPVPAAQAVDVDAICNAYESGVGHRGRPTANVNPYRECTPEHEAYAIGAKGEAAQAEAKVADVNAVALAWQEGYAQGHNDGLGCGHPLATRCNHNPGAEWVQSDTYDALLAAKAKGG